jgi:phosphate:Na+ symporter
VRSPAVQYDPHSSRRRVFAIYNHLQASSLALNQAAREELRLIDQLKLMLRTVWLLIAGRNIRLVSKVEELQQRLELIQEGLKDYLSQVSDENLSEEDVNWKFILLDYSHDLTTVGLLIKRDLSDAAIRQIQSNLEVCQEDKAELEALYARTLERMEKATLLVMSRDPSLAEQFIREKEQINVQVRLSRKARVEKPLSARSDSAKIIDMIDCLRRLNSQLTSIGYAILRNVTPSGKTNGPMAPVEDEEALSQNAGQIHTRRIVASHGN